MNQLLQCPCEKVQREVQLCLRLWSGTLKKVGGQKQKLKAKYPQKIYPRKEWN